MVPLYKHKKILIIVLLLIVVTSIYYYLESGKTYQSTTMYMYIEKKDHHIEPAKYMKMWAVGSNTFDNNPDKSRYKVMIRDSKIYNLLEEEREYFVTIHGTKKRNQEDYIYTFSLLALLDGTRLSGEGKIQ